jgi:mannosyltransferase OCH1-like enzyme
MTGVGAPIPRIVHQLWKDGSIPERWAGSSQSVRRDHKGWEYRLWTDETMDQHVRTHHADLYPVFTGMNRHIMRCDVFRYVLMSDFGGLYCDLDYEFVRPYDYGSAEVVLSLEYDRAYGDDVDQIANYVFASVPGHALWEDTLARVQAEPPHAATPADVCTVTGPGLITAVYFRDPDRYQGIELTHQPVLSPRRVHGRYERKFYINSGVTYGFHHGWGSWRERWNLAHVRRKLRRWTERLLGPRDDLADTGPAGF